LETIDPSFEIPMEALLIRFVKKVTIFVKYYSSDDFFQKCIISFIALFKSD